MSYLKEKMLDTECPHCEEVGCFEWESGSPGFPGSREEPPEDPVPPHWYCTVRGEPLKESIFTEEDCGDWKYEQMRDRKLDEEWEKEHG